MAGERIAPPTLEQQAQLNMEALKANPYPGRGIAMGLNENGNAIQVYWLMGRSENSRNRIFVEEGGVVRTQAFDESKVTDPSLIIYTAMRVVDGNHIVSNGDQTDSVAEHIRAGRLFAQGLEERTYEPDGPNFTPRITGQYNSRYTSPFQTSIIRKAPDSEDAIRVNQALPVKKGFGKCYHTYNGDGESLPSFDGNPYDIILKGSGKDIASTYWDLLDPDNKVSLVVKEIDKQTGESTFTIINAHQPETIPSSGLN